MVLEANEVAYDNDTKDVFATENVRIDYAPYVITSDYFEYVAQDRRLLFKGNVVVKEKGRTFQSRAFEFDFDTQKGIAHDIKSTVDGTIIKGKRLSVTATETTVDEVGFTTCSLDEPHYVFQANKVRIYPETGDFVANHNTVNLFGAPIFYFPTYVHSSKSRTVKQNSTIPEFGYNRIDGTFFKLNYAYFMSPRSNGTISIGSTTFRGNLYGFNHRLGLHPDHRLFIKAYDVQDTGFEGGLIYEWDLMRPKGGTYANSFFDQLYSVFATNDQSRMSSNFTAHYVYNESINYHLVDYLPMVQWDVDHIQLPYDWQLSTEVSSGEVRDSQASTDRSEGIGVLSHEWTLTEDWSMASTFTQYRSYYGTGDRWERILGTLSFSYESALFKPEISYTRLFSDTGGSPFLYDSENVIASDEIGLKLTSNLWGKYLALDVDYDLNDQSLRDATITTGLKQHCWMLMVSWNMVWQEFRLGVSVIPHE